MEPERHPARGRLGVRRRDLHPGLDGAPVEGDRGAVQERAEEPAVPRVRLGGQPRNPAVAGLPRGSAQILGSEVVVVDRNVDPVGAVFEEGGVDLDLAELVGGSGGGKDEKDTKDGKDEGSHGGGYGF